MTAVGLAAVPSTPSNAVTPVRVAPVAVKLPVNDLSFGLKVAGVGNDTADATTINGEGTIIFGPDHDTLLMGRKGISILDTPQRGNHS